MRPSLDRSRPETVRPAGEGLHIDLVDLNGKTWSKSDWSVESDADSTMFNFE